jgi:hypothetical protein
MIDEPPANSDNPWLLYVCQRRIDFEVDQLLAVHCLPSFSVPSYLRISISHEYSLFTLAGHRFSLDREKESKEQQPLA